MEKFIGRLVKVFYVKGLGDDRSIVSHSGQLIGLDDTFVMVDDIDIYCIKKDLIQEIKILRD